MRLKYCGLLREGADTGTKSFKNMFAYYFFLSNLDWLLQNDNVQTFLLMTLMHIFKKGNFLMK